MGSRFRKSLPQACIAPVFQLFAASTRQFHTLLYQWTLESHSESRRKTRDISARTFATARCLPGLHGIVTCSVPHGERHNACFPCLTSSHPASFNLTASLCISLFWLYRGISIPPERQILTKDKRFTKVPFKPGRILREAQTKNNSASGRQRKSLRFRDRLPGAHRRDNTTGSDVLFELFLPMLRGRQSCAPPSATKCRT